MRRVTLRLAVILAAPSLAAETRLTLTTENNPPFPFMDVEQTRVVGIAGDVVAEIMKRAAQPHETVLLPWPRAYALAQERADHCVFATTITAERQPLFRWVAPIARGGLILMGRPDFPGPVSTLADVATRLIGVVSGDASEKLMQERGHRRLEGVTEAALNARKLDAGRIDLWATGRLNGPWNAKLQGVGPFKEVLPITDTVLGLACHPRTDTAIIDRLNAALATIDADGTTQAILTRYR